MLDSSDFKSLSVGSIFPSSTPDIGRIGIALIPFSSSLTSSTPIKISPIS